jgi:hypothetical protein
VIHGGMGGWPPAQQPDLLDRRQIRIYSKIAIRRNVSLLARLGAMIGAILGVLLAVAVSACLFYVVWWLIGKL